MKQINCKEDLINCLIGDINVTSHVGLKNFKNLTCIDLTINIWNYLKKNKYI